MLSAATALPLLAVSALAAFLVFQQQQETLVTAALSRNHATLEAVDAEVRGTINLLNSLAIREEIFQNAGAEFHRVAQAVLSTQPQLQNLVLSAPDGRQLANARLPWGSPLLQEVVDKASFSRLITTGRPTVGSLSFAPRLGDEPGVAVRVVILQGQGVAGVITAVIRPTVFQKILEDQRLPEGWVSGLVGSDGRFIARTPAVKLGSLAGAAFLNNVRDADAGWYRGNTVEGLDTYSAFAKSRLTGWSIGFGIPAEAVTRGPLRTALLFLTGVVASLLGAMAIGYWLVARIAHPIQHLARAAPGLRQGRSYPPIATAVDEVTALAAALDAAATSIRERDAELLRQRDELAAQADALRQVDENKTRFLAQVSHELRGPLGTVRYAMELIDKSPDTAVRAQARSTIRRQLDLLTRLVNDFIDLGRVERGQLDLALARVDLQEIVQRCIDVVRSQLEAKQQVLSVTYATGPLHVLGDADRLTQVVSNLLSNTTKYTPPGGHIQIRLALKDDEAVVAVQDDGDGFSKADAERMFEMFVRLEGAHGTVQGSLGIGLAVTKAIVELHRGRITAHSEGPDRGAVFTVRLPVNGPDVANQPQIDTAPSKRQTT